MSDSSTSGARRWPSPRGTAWHRLVLTPVLVATVLAALAATLHSLAILPLWVERIPVTDVRPLEGAAYFAPMPVEPFFAGPSRTERLYEDATALPYPMLPGYGAISKSGSGRFHISANTLFFSASDSSDPRSNGRSYFLERPLSLSAAVLGTLWLSALAAGVLLVWLHRPFVTALLVKPPFAVVAGVLLLFVVANRAWLFVGFPVPAIHPDSTSYYALTDQLHNGEWPRFGVRPPVYPLFMQLMFAVADRVMWLIAAQTVLSTLAALTIVYAVYRWRTWLGIPTAVAMAGYLLSTASFEHDTGMLSESLYSTFLVFSFGSLLLGLRGVRPVAWMAVSSAAMALAILTRPAGMFLVVTYALVLLFVLWNRWRRTAIVAFAVPLPVLLLAMCFYNWRTIEVFAVSAWGEANLAVGTFTYWAPDPSYPPEINDGIGKIRAFVDQRIAETGANAAVLDTSWDPVELSRVFILGFHGGPLDIAMRMGGGTYEQTGRGWIRRIAFDSIRKRPRVYAKFVYSMLYNYFRPWPEDDFRAYVMNRAQALFVERRFSAATGNGLLVRTGKEFADASPPTNIVITDTNPAAPIDLSERVLLRSTPGLRLYQVTHVLRKWAFNRWLWPGVAFATLLLSTVVLAATRGRSVPAFAAWIMTISLLGASLVISLVEYSQPRYSYPMEWTYVVAPLFAALLASRRPSPIREVEAAPV